mgnify:CR=1 FL=1
MNIQRNLTVGVTLISIFVFVVSVLSLYVQITIQNNNVCGCVVPLPIFIPFVASLGFFIGSLIYTIFSPREKEEINISALLKLFNEDERSIVKLLMKNKGNVKQTDIVKETGMTRVAVSRKLKELEAKGIIERKNVGKINIVRFTGEYEKLFLNRKIKKGILL